MKNRSVKNLTLLCLTMLFFSACNPQIRYLGEFGGRPNQHIDVYYDAYDIEQNYKVLGIMSVVPNALHSIESIKKSMIEHCRKVGADAILFTALVPVNNAANVVEARVLKYTVHQESSREYIQNK